MQFISVGKENSQDIELYLQGLGQRTAHRLQPRLAAERGRF